MFIYCFKIPGKLAITSIIDQVLICRCFEPSLPKLLQNCIAHALKKTLLMRLQSRLQSLPAERENKSPESNHFKITEFCPSNFAPRVFVPLLSAGSENSTSSSQRSRLLVTKKGAASGDENN